MKWYVMYRATCLGVYDLWSSCNEQVIACKCCSFKLFNSRNEAENDYTKYVLIEKSNYEVGNGVGKLIGLSGFKNLIILFQLVLIVVLLLSRDFM